MFTYLLINFFSIAVPFAFSFESKLKFSAKWKCLFPAIILPAIFFLVWDGIFTHLGVWGFNERYLTGIEIFNLPLEELLFFICIPYACVFTYEVLNHFVKKDLLGKYVSAINFIFIISLGIIAVIFHDRLYTFYTALFTLVFLLLHQFFLKTNYLGRAYLAYLVILLPFFLVNGILTGSFLDEPVVWYNNVENLSVRLFTIPVEDTVYGLLLFLMNVTVFEFLKSITIDKTTLHSI